MTNVSAILAVESDALTPRAPSVVANANCAAGRACGGRWLRCERRRGRRGLSLFRLGLHAFPHCESVVSAVYGRGISVGGQQQQQPGKPVKRRMRRPVRRPGGVRVPVCGSAGNRRHYSGAAACAM
ncbi:hypothetical protein MTO96_006812 [Rhipicephalus appendiculatus]